jgi:hypothetical protein
MEPRERAARLRHRAELADDAAKAVMHAEEVEAELADIQASFDSSVEVQLGIILAKRKIKVGELCGSWPVHKRGELSKLEFRDNISDLLMTNYDSPHVSPRSPRAKSPASSPSPTRSTPGSARTSPSRSSPGSGRASPARAKPGSSPTRSTPGSARASPNPKKSAASSRSPPPGSPPSPSQQRQHDARQIDALFDKIDTDNSGFLDIAEAKVALKQLQDHAKQSIKEKDAKASIASRARRRASRKTQLALATPKSIPEEDGDVSAESADEADPEPMPHTIFTARNYIASIFSKPKNFFDSEARRDLSARKATAEAKAQKATLLLAGNRLAKGWHSWLAWYEQHKQQLSLLQRSLGAMGNGGLHRSWLTWRSVYTERIRRLKVSRLNSHTMPASQICPPQRFLFWEAPYD